MKRHKIKETSRICEMQAELWKKAGRKMANK